MAGAALTSQISCLILPFLPLRRAAAQHGGAVLSVSLGAAATQQPRGTAAAAARSLPQPQLLAVPRRRAAARRMVCQAAKQNAASQRNKGKEAAASAASLATAAGASFAAGAPAPAPPPGPSPPAVGSAVGGPGPAPLVSFEREYTLQRSYSTECYVRSRVFSCGDWLRVEITTTLPSPMLLHWGVVPRGGQPTDWLPPADELRPAGTVSHKDHAVQTEMLPFQSDRERVPGVAICMHRSATPAAIRFVLKVAGRLQPRLK